MRNTTRATMDDKYKGCTHRCGEDGWEHMMSSMECVLDVEFEAEKGQCQQASNAIGNPSHAVLWGMCDNIETARQRTEPTRGIPHTTYPHTHPPPQPHPTVS